MEFVVNGRYTLVAETGVQRYARLIGEHLEGAVLIKPAGRWASSRRMANLWEQLLLPIQRGNQISVWSPANIGPVLCSRQMVTIHDAAPFADPRWFSRAFALWYMAAWRVMVAAGVKVCTVSRFSRTELAKYLGLRESEIGLVANGGDHVRKLERRRPGNLDLPEGTPFALSVGSVQPRKNLAVLARACEQTEGLGGVLVIVGGGDSIFGAEGSFAPENRSVRLLGRITDEELAWLYSEATIFVGPSLYEGFDIPPLEALNLGCPILLSDIPVHREVYGDAAGYFSPCDTAGLAREIRAAFCAGRRLRPTEAMSALVERLTWARAGEQARSLISAWLRHEAGSVI